MKNFKELRDFAVRQGRKDCIVVKAEDETVLEGVRRAQELDIINPILIGHKNEIVASAEKGGLDLQDIEIIDIADEKEAIKKGVSIVQVKGDFLMKGLLSTSSFLKGILDKDFGLRTGKILSHIAVLEMPGYHKLLFMSDGGMNPKLDLKVRLDIIANGIHLLRSLGISRPKIGLIAASETVNPDMPETTDAQAIVNMHKKGDIRDAVIEGPFGFDVAVSREAAEHKKIKSEIAGDVDFILMPNISAANIWAKGLMYFAGAKGAGIVAGAQRPVVMLSRADDSEAKLNSIALGVAVSKSHHTEP
jgi:phosphate butyryltransferase